MAHSDQTLTMSRRFARWGAGLKYEDLPQDVVDEVYLGRSAVTVGEP